MSTRRSFMQGGMASLVTGLVADGEANAVNALSAKSSGYRMPLESVPHVRTFMQWPAVMSIYGNWKFFSAVRSKVALIANTIARFEPVVMLVRPAQVSSARALLHPAVHIWEMDVEDLWCRDSGPTFVSSGSGQLAVSDLNFNGWGGKQQHRDDARVAGRVASRLGLRVFNNGLVGEGGGVETDGAGTLMAHASSWVNPNRNSGAKAEIGKLLMDALGAEKMIWAPGLKGLDITDYHIDSLARFVKSGQVVIQLPAKVINGDPWSAAAYETYNILKSATDAQGRKLDIAVIPDPVHIRSHSPDFVSSYVNYYVCNGAVITAEFGDDSADTKAAAALSALFPGRKIVSLNVDPIAESGGGIHCSTQQQPKT